MLIGFMIAAGPMAGLLAWAAHQQMRERTYTTPIPRYAVGVILALVPWTAACAATLWEAHDIHTIVLTLAVGIWYVFGCAGGATWLAYEHERPRATEADAARLITYIEREHGTDGGDPG